MPMDLPVGVWAPRFFYARACRRWDERAANTKIKFKMKLGSMSLSKSLVVLLWPALDWILDWVLDWLFSMGVP